MTTEMENKFKEILSRYTSMTTEKMTNDMRFREDLEMSSLDFMTLLGEIEDELDIEFENIEKISIETIGEAIEFLGRYL